MSDEKETEVEVLSSNAVESMTRGEIGTQIETAHRFPRSMERFKKHGIEMATIDDETAASCLYRRPVGKDETGQMKFAEGMSIRMAEIVGAAYGNLRVYATLMEQTERQVVARGMAMDLESNFASSSEVVESTVDAKGRPYSERMRAVVAKAALAKARRDATFQVVPKALARPIELAVRKLLLGGTKSMEKRRAGVLGWIGTLKDASHPSGLFDPRRVWRALGIEGESDLGLDHIETLTGIRTAIKDGETTINEAFPEAERYTAATAKAPTAAGASPDGMSYKAQLEAVLLQAAGNSAGAKAYLKELTGKVFMTNVSEAEAEKALNIFAAKQAAGQEAAKEAVA